MSEAELRLESYLERINGIMWESFMIEGRSFGCEQAKEIMEVLEEWTEFDQKDQGYGVKTPQE